MADRDPFHDGERYVQERAGEREKALHNAGVVGESIPARAIPFLAQQRMLAIGSVDEHGAVAASLVFGAREFVVSPDGRSVAIDRSRIESSREDSVWSNLAPGGDVGLLAIDLGTRRRLRINGVVTAIDDWRVEIGVREAYPNCPKYIQRRHMRESPGVRRWDVRRESGVALDEERSMLVRRADMLFVASRHPTRGVDISHRGGLPGFVRVLDSSRLRIPDYPGNSMFNTLGNFTVESQAGLVFLDFDGGGPLQMTGHVTLHFDMQEDPEQPTGGSGRYWDLHVTRWVALPALPGFAWELLDYSPHNPGGLI